MSSRTQNYEVTTSAGSGAEEADMEMEGKMWTYVEARVVKKEHGRLEDADGYLVSTQKASQAVVYKAIDFLSALFKLFNDHNVTICEDSEQEVVAIDLRNGFEVVYRDADQDADRNVAQILRSGFLVGNLTREKTE